MDAYGSVEVGSILLAGSPVSDVESYLRGGGGEGLRRAYDRGPLAVIEEIRRSGLQGRGGAGFPTGVKWESIASNPCPTRYVVCNAAEGEPGTFKDRWLLRHNPYQVLEGIAIAAYAVGAAGAYIAIKASFEREVVTLERAIADMRAAGLTGEVPVQLVTGPDDYLFGEEKALLEVLEGKAALPRILPPYQVGLFATSGSPNATLMNNVETLAHVTHVMRRGWEWFRASGSETCPGTALLTLAGDVRRPGVYELPLGAPLRTLLYDLGGGPPDGRQVKAVFPGASAAILSRDQLDTPLAFDAMRAAGSGLGSGGFVVYDESACMVQVAAAFSRFLYVESCGQCPACKQGTLRITECLERMERGTGSAEDLEAVVARCRSVTGGSRCGLPSGESLLVSSAVELFGNEFSAHLSRGCPSPRRLPFPKIVDFDAGAGTFVYAGRFVYDVDGHMLDEAPWLT
ncbi:MAG: SLBB domain-containing protein [Actinomycetota bacterium]|nr:SLBB domain-containing protein [Actinomycetota bacterium]